MQDERRFAAQKILLALDYPTQGKLVPLSIRADRALFSYQTDEGSVVVRLADCPEPIERNALIIKALDGSCAPRLLIRGEGEGFHYTLEEFFPGKPLKWHADKFTFIPKILHALGQVNAVPLDAPLNTFIPTFSEELSKLLEILPARGAIAHFLRKKAPHLPFFLAHGDVQFINMFEREGVVKLIDFDSAMQAPKELDLGGFLFAHWKNDAVKQALLEASENRGALFYFTIFAGARKVVSAKITDHPRLGKYIEKLESVFNSVKRP